MRRIADRNQDAPAGAWHSIATADATQKAHQTTIRLVYHLTTITENPVGESVTLVGNTVGSGLTLPIRRPTLDTLLPHADDMCLLDAVTGWSDTRIVCQTESHSRRNNPLRSKQGLSSLQGIEYAAQAMAIHGALVAGRGSSPANRGYLVAVRNLKLFVDWLHDHNGCLEVSATLALESSQFIIHDFRIELHAEPLVSGRLNVLKSRGTPT
jgi:predicted hotdog family 3-hydroxylacyl-ACP dehydratase